MGSERVRLEGLLHAADGVRSHVGASVEDMIGGCEIDARLERNALERERYIRFSLPPSCYASRAAVRYATHFEGEALRPRRGLGLKWPRKSDQTFRAKIALEALREAATVRYGIHTNQIHGWKAGRSLRRKSLFVDTVVNITIGAVRMTRFAPTTSKQLNLRRCRPQKEAASSGKAIPRGSPCANANSRGPVLMPLW